MSDVERLAEVLRSLLYDAWESGVSIDENTDDLGDWLAPRLASVLAEYVATARAEEREQIEAVIREQVAQWRETYPKAWPPFRGMDEQLIRRIARREPA